jgi:hypothetical protein
MTDAPPDLEQLARRYLDLWQEQVAAMATDPAVAEAVAHGIAMMSQGTAALVLAAQAAAKDQAGAHEPTSSSEPQRSAAAAAAPDDACGDPGRLEARLAAVEQRIAALEAAVGGGGGKPAAKPRKRRA